MQTTQKRLWLISLLFTYLAIAVAGFLVVYEIKHNFIAQNAAIPTPVISNVKPIKTPAGWKTYSNQADKISFAYPPADHIKASSYGLGVTSVSLENNDSNVDFQILFLPKTLAAAVGQDFDSYYAMQNNTTKIIKSPMSQDTTTEKFTKIRDRSIAGLQALDYQSLASNAPSGTQPEIGTLIAAGDTIILISTDSGNKTLREQLLSSFTYTQ